MMRTIQYSFPLKADGLEISCAGGGAGNWDVMRNTKALLGLFHGMSEHIRNGISHLWNI